MTYFAVDSYEPKSIRNELIEAFMHGTANDRWYALIDTAFDHGSKPLNWVGSDRVAIYHLGRLAPLAGASPTLFPLAWHDRNQMDQELTRLLHHCRGRPMLSFIRSRLEPEQLRENWQSVLEIETKDAQSFVLRFADTRVTPEIALQDDIWCRLAANIAEWKIIERNGALLALEIPENFEKFDGRLPPVRITDQGLAQLLSSGQPDALAEVLSEHFPDLLAVRKGYTNFQLLNDVCKLCAAYAIDGFSDQVALSVATMITDRRLLTHEDFNDWLTHKPWLNGGMEDALADFMDTRAC